MAKTNKYYKTVKRVCVGVCVCMCGRGGGVTVTITLCLWGVRWVGVSVTVTLCVCLYICLWDGVVCSCVFAQLCLCVCDYVFMLVFVCVYVCHTCQHLGIRNRDAFIIALTPPPPPPLQTKYFSYTHAVKRGRWKQINRALHSAPKSMSHSYVLYFENPNLCLTPFIRPIMPKLEKEKRLWQSVSYLSVSLSCQTVK